MIDYEFHSYISVAQILLPSGTRPSSPNARALSSATAHPCSISKNWLHVKRVIDRVYKHISEHAMFSDTCTLLLRACGELARSQ